MKNIRCALLFGVGVLQAVICNGETFYVRTDGGTAGQCTGLVDVPYNGLNQDCAWSHPFWALDDARQWKLRGGDTLLINEGSYVIGVGAPNSERCTSAGSCAIPSPPAGPDEQNPTRIVGAGWNTGCSTAPELWGTQGLFNVIRLLETSNVELSCLEITDHSACAIGHPSVGCTTGEWATNGIYSSGSKNVRLSHLNIHGMAGTGIRAGRLSNWTVEDVQLSANGLAGWDGDLGPPGGDAWSNSGSMVFRRWTVEWSGCPESFPEKRPDNCWAQTTGGYGDGLGTSASAGRWIIEDSHFRYNTQDGVDLVYIRPIGDEPASIEIRRSTAVGNAGNQFKFVGDVTLVNSLAVGNCAFFVGKPFAMAMGGRTYGDHCRAGGDTIRLVMLRGVPAGVVNSTIVGQGDTLMSIGCLSDYGGSSSPCLGTEPLTIQNNVFAGYGDFIGGDKAAWIYDPVGYFRNHTAFNVYHNVKEYQTPCPEGEQNICADPLFVDPEFDTFDATPRPGSPAIDSGLPAGSLNGLVPSEDINLTPRPQGNGLDRGAYEFAGAASQASRLKIPIR